MKYRVYIFDSESGCNQPMICEASGVSEAKRKGMEYIRAWHLQDGAVTQIERMED